MQDILNFINQHPLLVSIACFLLILLFVIEVLRLRFNKVCIDMIEAIKKMNHENAVIVDTRVTDQYRAGHILDAISIPAKDIMNSKKLEKYKKRPIIVVCKAGIESRKVATGLVNQGYNAYSLNGGLKAWVDAEMPVVKE